MTILGIGIIWLIYGIACLFGFKILSHKYEEITWFEKYRKCQAISYIVAGVLLIGFFIIAKTFIMQVVLSFIAVGSICIWVFWYEKKFKIMYDKINMD